LSDEACVKFISEVDPEMHLMIDKDRLKVVLNNLVSNAIKYHDPNKKDRFLKIEASVKDGNCLIRVSDNGIGIPRDYHEKVFDMFFRASERSDGSGLGLYIVRETLERLKGDITCQSAEGEGSTFEVRLPVSTRLDDRLMA
jgi:signal transduction histidine kinase